MFLSLPSLFVIQSEPLSCGELTNSGEGSYLQSNVSTTRGGCYPLNRTSDSEVRDSGSIHLICYLINIDRFWIARKFSAHTSHKFSKLSEWHKNVMNLFPFSLKFIISPLLPKFDVFLIVLWQITAYIMTCFCIKSILIRQIIALN